MDRNSLQTRLAENEHTLLEGDTTRLSFLSGTPTMEKRSLSSQSRSSMAGTRKRSTLVQLANGQLVQYRAPAASRDFGPLKQHYDAELDRMISQNLGPLVPTATGAEREARRFRRAVETGSFATGRKKRSCSERVGTAAVARRLDFCSPSMGTKKPDASVVPAEAHKKAETNEKEKEATQLEDYVTNVNNDTMSELEREAVVLALPNGETPLKRAQTKKDTRKADPSLVENKPRQKLYEESVRASRDFYAYSDAIKEFANAQSNSYYRRLLIGEARKMEELEDKKYEVTKKLERVYDP